jgi:hypothetical protein
MKQEIQNHRLFDRRIWTFNSTQERFDQFPVIVTNGRNGFSRPFLTSFPPVVFQWRRRIYLDSLFHVLEPPEKDAQPATL